MGPVYADRREAGRRLAGALAVEDGAVAVGLANGGVVVAAEVARALGVPLDALAVVKVGHPDQPEFAMGAVAPGVAVVRGDPGPPPEVVEARVDAAREACRRRDGELHARRRALPVGGRTVLLVDDGLATGATMLAAVRWARARGAARIVACVPVAAAQSAALVRREADDVVCPCETPDLRSVAAWYGVFAPVSIEEVVALLDAGPLPTA